MKILITGSSGMLGTDLCRVLKDEHEIAGVDLAEPKETSCEPQVFYKASINDPGSLKEIFDKENPDLIIHTAAWTDVDGCEKDPEKAYMVNVTGTQNIVNALSGKDIPVILISTDFVFNGEKGEPYSESDRPDPISVYGRTKLEAEEVVQRGLTRYAIVRTSWLFGKNGRNFVDTIIGKSREEKRLRVVSDQIGSPTHTIDLANALKELLLFSNDFGKEIYHIANTGWCSWYDFALKILENVPEIKGTTVESITSGELDRPAKRPKFSVLDCSKFKEKTKHQMQPWEDALKVYFKERGLRE